jgi:O-antigen ligase
VAVAGVAIGTAAGWLAGAKPLYLIVLLVAAMVLVCFLADIELAVMSLLILRSSLDIFSAQQIPAAYAIGIDALTLLYVTLLLLTGQPVRSDWFWWFFAGWVILQGLWPILCAIGGLGLGAGVLLDNIREWMRIFSWLMVYLLVMQLKDRVHPEKLISLLFISLIPPVAVALIQIFLPDSLLPALLRSEGQRISGTLGHPNALVTYLLLFIGLICWKLRQARNRLPWLLLLSLLAFVFVGAKALFSLAMLGTFVLVLITPRLNLTSLIGGILLLVVVLGLFASTEFGVERLRSIAQTPLFNSNIDVSRAILLSNSDNNSFNWRIAQWTYLLKSWQQSPIFGYGLATSRYLSIFHLYAHNDYIRALVEGGIVGLVTFFAFLAAQSMRLVQLLRSAPRGSAQRDLCWILLAFFLATLIAMLTENIWSHTLLYFYWWTILAIAGWNWNQPQPLETPVVTSPIAQQKRFTKL